MARRNNASKKKQIEEELMDSMSGNDFEPIKRQLKINQFKWTEKQKSFLNLLYIMILR
tara:strand:+ start:445 stop:618 length:174 start_codon:yes stop_codon:yes gene_type:complete